MVAESLANMRVGGKEANSANLQNCSQEQAAKKLNVSPGSVATARKVKQKAEPEVRKAVEDGKLSLNAAAQIADLPKEQQKKVMKDPRPDRAVKKLARQNKEKKLAAKQMALPEKRYGLFMAGALCVPRLPFRHIPNARYGELSQLIVAEDGVDDLGEEP